MPALFPPGGGGVTMPGAVPGFPPQGPASPTPMPGGPPVAPMGAAPPMGMDPAAGMEDPASVLYAAVTQQDGSVLLHRKNPDGSLGPAVKIIPPFKSSKSSGA